MVSPIDAPWWAVLTLYVSLTLVVLIVITAICVWAGRRNR